MSSSLVIAKIIVILTELLKTYNTVTSFLLMAIESGSFSRSCPSFNFVYVKFILYINIYLTETTMIDEESQKGNKIRHNMLNQAYSVFYPLLFARAALLV